MLPPFKEEVVSNGLEPWCDQHTAVITLRLSHQFTEFTSSHVAVTLDFIGIGCHSNISLNEEDVVNLMFPPCGVRLGLVVDPSEVSK